MYPRDNVFNIYYNIGKRVPFQVKRSPLGLKGSRDIDYRYSQEGRTFMVERVEIRNRVYGTAYGYLMIDGVRNDHNPYMEHYEPGTVPCAGCGEWVLIDVPGVDLEEVFPLHKPDFVLPFGKYKGETLLNVFLKDPGYINWLMQDKWFRIDINALNSLKQNVPTTNCNGAPSSASEARLDRVRVSHTVQPDVWTPINSNAPRPEIRSFYEDQMLNCRYECRVISHTEASLFPSSPLITIPQREVLNEYLKALQPGTDYLLSYYYKLVIKEVKMTSNGNKIRLLVERPNGQQAVWYVFEITVNDCVIYHQKIGSFGKRQFEKALTAFNNDVSTGWPDYSKGRSFHCQEVQGHIQISAEKHQ